MHWLLSYLMFYDYPSFSFLFGDAMIIGLKKLLHGGRTIEATPYVSRVRFLFLLPTGSKMICTDEYLITPRK
jgi:hypothetical protein